jgi:CelD/BcsL family acetyltransferase involved in cellulose biosynthesis
MSATAQLEQHPRGVEVERPRAQPRRPQAGNTPDEPLEIDLVQGREAFVALEKEWNAALARGPRDEPMLRHEWLRAHVENFTPGAPLRVFLARTGRELHAAIPLIERREQSLDTCGLPLVTWELPASDHSQRGGILLGRRFAEALTPLWRRIQSEPGWDRLRLRDLPEGAPEWRLRELADRDGFPCGLWTSLYSPFLPLPEGKPEERYGKVEAAVDARFRSNLRRRRKRLAEKHGEVKYVRVDGSDARALDQGLADFFDLEASGWKGKAGTAIAIDPRLVGYYTQLARDAAARNALHLSFVEAGGKRIAGHLAIAHAGRFFLVKVGYDEKFRELSPGQQLAAEAIRASCALGLREFDFLGPWMEWKADWEPKVRPHTWLTIFRPTSAGRLIHAARYVFWPVARAAAEQIRKRWPKAAPAAQEGT